ncbi:MAG: hypothetical protein ACK56I_17030, partial [bacterium]
MDPMGSSSRQENPVGKRRFLASRGPVTLADYPLSRLHSSVRQTDSWPIGLEAGTFVVGQRFAQSLPSQLCQSGGMADAL